jgi:hypothetical protein
MELLGRDLYQLRKERKDFRFSLGTALRVGLESLEVPFHLQVYPVFASNSVSHSGFARTPRRLRIHLEGRETRQLCDWAQHQRLSSQRVHDRLRTVQTLQRCGNSIDHQCHFKQPTQNHFTHSRTTTCCRPEAMLAGGVPTGTGLFVHTDIWTWRDGMTPRAGFIWYSFEEACELNDPKHSPIFSWWN